MTKQETVEFEGLGSEQAADEVARLAAEGARRAMARCDSRERVAAAEMVAHLRPLERSVYLTPLQQAALSQMLRRLEGTAGLVRRSSAAAEKEASRAEASEDEARRRALLGPCGGE